MEQPGQVTYVVFMPLWLPHALLLRLCQRAESATESRLGLLEPANPFDILIRQPTELTFNQECVSLVTETCKWPAKQLPLIDGAYVTGIR